MFRSSWLAQLAVTLAGVSAANLPGRHVVELDDLSVLGAKRVFSTVSCLHGLRSFQVRSSNYLQPHVRLYEQLSAANVPFDVMMEYDHAAFVGASISMVREVLFHSRNVSNTRTVGTGSQRYILSRAAVSLTLKHSTCLS